MIAAGVARIAMATAIDLQPPGSPDCVHQDPAAIRRDLQLVTSGLHALLARYGLAVTIETAGRGVQTITGP